MFIVNGGLEEQIAFTPTFHPDQQPPGGVASAIEVLDPVNFDNNMAWRYDETDRLLLVQAAQKAYDAFTTARFVPTKTEAVECWQDVLGSRSRERRDVQLLVVGDLHAGTCQEAGGSGHD